MSRDKKWIDSSIMEIMEDDFSSFELWMKTENPPYGDEVTYNTIHPHKFPTSDNWYVMIKHGRGVGAMRGSSFRIEAIPDMMRILYEIWERWYDGECV